MNEEIDTKIRRLNESLLDLDNNEIYEDWGWIINHLQGLRIKTQKQEKEVIQLKEYKYMYEGLCK